ncbi:MAG: alpha/beta fold hydrolase [Elusimicrobiota bacterium]
MTRTSIPGARAETIDVAGLKTHLIRAGSGEPVILLHGLGASSYSWRFAVAELARRYEVFAPDLPGFGRTDKPRDFDYSIAGLHRWVLSLMDVLGLRSARFAGNSMGGVITLWLAMEAGDRVERMALLGTPAYPENRPKFLGPLGWPLIGPLYEWALGETTLRYVVRTTFVDQSKVTEEMISEYLAPLKTAAGRRAVAEFVRRSIPPDAAARIASYPTLKQRALVLAGDADRMVDRRGAERLSRDLPRARFVYLERCGHAPQEDAPERVVPLLRDFFAE